MKPRHRIVLFAVLLGGLILGGLWVFGPDPTDPLYQGRPLSQWLLAFPLTPGSSGPDQLRAQLELQQADAAVHAVGTNALPVLLSMLVAQDAPWRAKLYRELQYRLPGRFYSRLAVEKNSLAVRYFGILGPDGRYAVPGLVNLYARSAPGSPARENVLAALAELGPQAVAAVPVLASAVAAKTNSEGQVLAILALSRLGTNADPAAPELIAALQNQHYVIRAAAAACLGGFRGDVGRQVLPALRHLRDTSPTNRYPPLILSEDTIWLFNCENRGAGDSIDQSRATAELAIRRIEEDLPAPPVPSP